MFNKKRESLIQKLEEIKLQIQAAEKEINSRKMTHEEATAIMAALTEKREQIESQLLELIVETEDSFQHEAWVGFKRGLVASLQTIEEMVDKSVEHHKVSAEEKDAEKGGIFSSIYAKIAARPWLGWVTTGVLVYLLLLAVDCLSGGFKMVSGGPEGVKALFAFASNPFAGLLVGIMATALIQSSSTTTSLIVPLAGAGVMTLLQVFPFTLGANIGTCITALLAALAIQTGAEFALQIAFVHLFFNVFSVVLIYSLPFLRNIPLFLARELANVAVKQKILALAYVLGVFFILPGIFIVSSKMFAGN